ncbi:MAG: 16S rRNA processing protein RimM [Deltaproteobacteria bacterium]|nr:16S rRNA processing protein RimM [Deltaproteobacteria bacterium]
MKDLLEIGKIVKPCGFKGRLRVYSYLQSKESLRTLDEVIIADRGGENKSYRVRGVSFQGSCFILDCEGIEDVDGASALRGCPVFMFSDKLNVLPDGEYYWKDLIGLSVITDKGDRLGAITSIIPTGSNDVYVVGSGEREVLIPALTDVILSVDLDKGVVVVSLMEEL